MGRIGSKEVHVEDVIQMRSRPEESCSDRGNLAVARHGLKMYLASLRVRKKEEFEKKREGDRCDDGERSPSEPG